jgi:L-fuculose-phosphate aldolase
VGGAVAITPSGIAYPDMTAAGICLVTLAGAQLAGDGVGQPAAPSSETPMHLAIYAATSAAAVVHTHSPEVVALSASRQELPAIHYAITALGGPVRVAPYQRFGSDQLAAAALAALDGRSAVILRNHGAVTYGADLAQAYRGTPSPWRGCSAPSPWSGSSWRPTCPRTRWTPVAACRGACCGRWPAPPCSAWSR